MTDLGGGGGKGVEGREENYNMALRIMMALPAQCPDNWPDGAFYQCTLAVWKEQSFNFVIRNIHKVGPDKSRGGLGG